MGGIGSGRGFQGGKDTISDYCSLDVRRLQRDGLLAPARSFGWNWYSNDEKVASIQIHTQVDRLMLDYRHRKDSEEWKTQNYPVMLDWTACLYGGRRAWLLCPANGCGRRVAMLYIGGAGIFACRHCYQLVYTCQRETPDDRAARRADKIRDRLEWGRGILNDKGCKPKGMHWKTFQQLTTRHDAFVDVSLVGIARRLGILKNLLD